MIRWIKAGYDLKNETGWGYWYLPGIGPQNSWAPIVIASLSAFYMAYYPLKADVTPVLLKCNS